MTKGLSTEHIRLMLASCPAGIGIVKDNLLSWANPCFHEILGYADGSLAGRNLETLFPTEKAYQKVWEKLRSDTEKYGAGAVETRLNRKGGAGFDCRIRTSFLDKETPENGIVAALTDITQFKTRQIQRQQAEKMEAIGVLAGGISHDFNNILMGIQGHLSLMRIDLKARERIASHISQIGKLVDTAAELTRRLLGFARGGKYQIETLDINDVLSVSLKVFMPGRKDVSLHESYARDLRPADGDRSQLEQVFLNILVNASQAMVDEGELFAGTRNIAISENHSYPFEIKPGPYVEVCIRDTGMGMDNETQKKIFDPFFSTREIGDKKGRGLGLSTVYGIVKNHGGFILVESRKGEGAVFKICLPASRNLKAAPARSSMAGLDAMLKGSETVLLVDDEEEIITVGKNFLVELGYRAMTARNGLEAVEIFKLYRDEIDLVVLDLIMPKMDGKKAFTRLKELKKDIKILVATGYTVDDEVEKLLRWGCNGFIQKPFSMHAFSRAVRQVLDREDA